MKLILSLSGGGKRGILYSKLIPEIQKQHEIIGVYGVSIGAIVGFAIMSNIDLTTLFNTQEFKILLNLSNDTQRSYVHDLTENSRSPISNFPLNHEHTISVKKPLTPHIEDMRGQCIVDHSLVNYFDISCRDNILKNALLRLFKLAKVNTNTMFKDFPGLCVSACIQGKPNVVYMSSVCNNDIRVFDALYASACVPILFTPMLYKGLKLFDAGVLENLIIPGTSINQSSRVSSPMFNNVVGIYLDPVQTSQWVIDALYTWQYLWNLKYAQNCIPVFVANARNYSEILNFIENQVKT